MAIYVYDKATGALVSYCPEDTDPVADAATLAKKGFDVVIGAPKLADAKTWDTATKAVIDIAPAAKPQPPSVTGTLVIDGVTYQVTLTEGK